MTFLKWDNLVSGHHATEPLHEPFSGKIDEPGLYAVLGQNGCGKSSLLKTWLQFLPALGGNIQLLDLAPPKKRVGTAHLPGVAFVPQHHRVNSFFHTVTEDLVAQGLGPHPAAGAQERLEAALLRWKLSSLRQRSFHELSQGQKTRALLARAFLARPRLLFLDEPLASLDPCCQKELMDYLNELIKTEGLCVVMSDHHLEGFDDFIKGRILFERGHDEPLSTLCVEIKR